MPGFLANILEAILNDLKEVQLDPIVLDLTDGW